MAANIVTTCDICDDEESEARTIRFHFSDQDYEIDVCADHLSAYVTFMQPLLENARRADVFAPEAPRSKGRRKAPRVDGRVQVQPWVNSRGKIVHSDRKDTPSKCMLCGRPFDGYQGLARHLISQHNDEELDSVGWTRGLTYEEYLDRWGRDLGETSQASISLKGLVKSRDGSTA